MSVQMNEKVIHFLTNIDYERMWQQKTFVPMQCKRGQHLTFKSNLNGRNVYFGNTMSVTSKGRPW